MNLSSGTKLGPYEVVSLLGAGGMGEVYRARDSRLKREVAIKVLPQALSLDADRLRRFEQEALATAALNHPNILAVFDIGTHEGAPYVVSELLEGETLRERLRGGAIAVRKTLDYGLQVAHGLAAAHEKGIVHRDLKPENLFLTKDGRVKILDFGLAKLTQPDLGAGGAHTSLPTMTHATEAGVVMGTAGYMSPEQVRGTAVDARSDIFSFGAILYEMISGKRAFHRETAADTMSAILKEDPADLSETNRNVSPALERIVQHCLEKNPEQRFHAASDIAFDLEHLTGASGISARSAAVAAAPSRNKFWGALAGGVVLALLMLGAGWWLGRGSAPTGLAEYKQITFRTGSIGHARFTPDGSIVYSARWDGGESQLYMARTDDPGSRELGLKDAEILAVSKSGELAVRLRSVILPGYARLGTLARVPLSGGTPREMLDNVQDADWSKNDDTMAIVRYAPDKNHWHLEYPIGKIVIDRPTWISHPKISPDGKWVAFADHENNGGDDEGSIAVISSDGKGTEKKLSSGWESIQGVVWSPAGDEVWFAATKTGSGDEPHGVSLSGKVRSLTNVPGGMWLEDMRNGTALAVTNQNRLGIRGTSPGSKEERELGWFGWSIIRDISRDGHKILFIEAGDGGGPNYTVFLRDTDGSPPSRIGEGDAMALSPDAKWAITKPPHGGALNLVPTGAGEARAITHDAVDYDAVTWMPDGKRLLASGIEAGHGERNYVIDLSSGDSKAVTPDGVSGVRLSPDGKNAAVLGTDGKWEVWAVEGGTFHPVPGLDGSFRVIGWSPDGGSLYAVSSRANEKVRLVYKVDPESGKMESWKTFGQEASAGLRGVGGISISGDGSAYAYVYVVDLSQAFVVTGLK
jgi:eukaryotic-like serine/threonine-protein kinase